MIPKLLVLLGIQMAFSCEFYKNDCTMSEKQWLSYAWNSMHQCHNQLTGINRFSPVAVEYKERFKNCFAHAWLSCFSQASQSQHELEMHLYSHCSYNSFVLRHHQERFSLYINVNERFHINLTFVWFRLNVCEKEAVTVSVYILHTNNSSIHQL